MSDQDAVVERQVWRACPSCYGMGRGLLFTCGQCHGFGKVLGPPADGPIRLVKTSLGTATTAFVLLEVPVKQASIT